MKPRWLVDTVFQLRPLTLPEPPPAPVPPLKTVLASDQSAAEIEFSIQRSAPYVPGRALPFNLRRPSSPPVPAAVVEELPQNKQSQGMAALSAFVSVPIVKKVFETSKLRLKSRPVLAEMSSSNVDTQPPQDESTSKQQKRKYDETQVSPMKSSIPSHETHATPPIDCGVRIMTCNLCSLPPLG